MKKVYILEHVYEVNEIEEIKFIGVFSSIENAKNAINELKNMQGFISLPIECFKIEGCLLDRFEWKEGFIKWEES